MEPSLGDNSYYSFWWNNLILFLYNVDTLNICMKEFIILVCTDSTEIFFSKLRSAGLNYSLPSFSLTLTVRWISNKYCLLTLFILVEVLHSVTFINIMETLPYKPYWNLEWSIKIHSWRNWEGKPFPWEGLRIVNTLYTNGFFLLVWYNKFGW